MSTSIIDGTIDAINLKRARSGIAIFNSIRFTLGDGSTRTVTKQIASQEVADALTVGASGRFYLFSAFDIKGIHGFRAQNGAAYYKFPGGSNTKIFLIAGTVSLCWVVLRATTQGDVPLLGVASFILSVVGFIFMSKGGREAKAQFEGDGGHVPPIDEPVAIAG